MRSAEKGGLDIGHVEVVTKDGTVIRVFGTGASRATGEARDASEVAEDRIAKMRATSN